MISCDFVQLCISTVEILSSSCKKVLVFRKVKVGVCFLVAVCGVACVSSPSINENVELFFINVNKNVKYGNIERLRKLANKVSQNYVRVSILGDESIDGDRGFENQVPVITGASGTLLNESGYVVTTAHIAKDSRYRARIDTIHGSTYTAEIVTIDSGGELALMRFSAPYRTSAPPNVL